MFPAMADQDALRLLAEAERHNDEEATELVGCDNHGWLRPDVGGFLSHNVFFF